eukprot:CAMPEP_0171523192 /NCGR_PEP_ID=MMETSP0959-20130129/8252_1 /TAXON_ID=87120 /ORGANISM="Aurantiochytrium limacinum, Strain ATCCMYA-1381" /LENGTH=99 /DNA_ID=CAMNT_0012063579 /DNA_START=415 /DNA_END=714 /DNA_ORIENTATION=-
MDERRKQGCANGRKQASPQASAPGVATSSSSCQSCSLRPGCTASSRISFSCSSFFFSAVFGVPPSLATRAFRMSDFNTSLDLQVSRGGRFSFKLEVPSQ